MPKDPIIDEIRKFREKHAAKFGFDPMRIVRDAHRREKQSGHKVVPPPSKRRKA